MTINWLWDMKISAAGAKAILKKPQEKKFIPLAAKLLSRQNNPKEVFKEYLDPVAFCQNWTNIKRRMRLDKWNEPRIIFWQAIYEKLLDRYRKKGMVFKREISPPPQNPLLIEIGNKIKDIRLKQGLSQKSVSEKLGVSQQIISRVEKGKGNVSVSTLVNISRALAVKVKIEFEA